MCCLCRPAPLPSLSPPLPAEENGSAPKTILYQLGEGEYGIFNSVLFDNTCPTPILQKVSLPHWACFQLGGCI